MIRKIINFLTTFTDKELNLDKSEQKVTFNKYDKTINNFKLEEQSKITQEDREHNMRLETLALIMKDSQKIFAKNIEEFNQFLKKYKFEFTEPSLSQSKIAGKYYVDPDIRVMCIGTKIYIAVHFNINDRTIYEDYKNDELKIKYDLYDKATSGDYIASTTNFDDVVKGFVDYHIKTLADR